MQELGFNFRITDMQCALGLSQLKKIEPFLSRRHEIAVIYNEALKDNKYIKTSLTTETRKSAYHLYTVQIDFLRLGKSRLSVMNELTKKESALRFIIFLYIYSLITWINLDTGREIILLLKAITAKHSLCLFTLK